MLPKPVLRRGLVQNLKLPEFNGRARIQSPRGPPDRPRRKGRRHDQDARPADHREKEVSSYQFLQHSGIDASNGFHIRSLAVCAHALRSDDGAGSFVGNYFLCLLANIWDFRERGPSHPPLGLRHRFGNTRAETVACGISHVCVRRFNPADATCVTLAAASPVVSFLHREGERPVAGQYSRGRAASPLCAVHRARRGPGRPSRRRRSEDCRLLGQMAR